MFSARKANKFIIVRYDPIPTTRSTGSPVEGKSKSFSQGRGRGSSQMPWWNTEDRDPEVIVRKKEHQKRKLTWWLVDRNGKL